ncbi:MAG TPA: ankyrin repeat domain-containing protein [Thermoguttaceae bacterium]|nr:ankyrin repeat domain-containing protein [Thermoguttaceae bacterium]
MPDTQLWQAVENDDRTALEIAIAQGDDVNLRNSDGLTPLMVAAGRGYTVVVRQLLDAGADLFAVDSKAGASALHKACQAGSLDVVRLLVEAGASVNAQTSTTGHTPIIEAIWFKWPDVVQYLLDQGTRLTIQTNYGFSLHDHLEYALHANVLGRDKLVRCKEMVEARQARDQEQVDRQQLMAAVCDGNLARVKELLRSGVPVDERSPILGGFNDAHTPLLVACRDGHTQIVVELLDAGADINAIEPTFLAVPLHKAVYNGHADITEILVKQPGIDLDVPGASNGYTPLHDAIWHGWEDCTTILLDAGARLDLPGHDGLTPLDLAEEVFGRDHPIVARIRCGIDAIDTHTCVS